MSCGLKLLKAFHFLILFAIFLCMAVNMGLSFRYLNRHLQEYIDGHDMHGNVAEVASLIEHHKSLISSTKAVHAIFFVIHLIAASVAICGAVLCNRLISAIYGVFGVVFWICQLAVVFGRGVDEPLEDGALLSNDVYLVFEKGSQFVIIAFYPISCLLAFVLAYIDTKYEDYSDTEVKTVPKKERY